MALTTHLRTSTTQPTRQTDSPAHQSTAQSVDRLTWTERDRQIAELAQDPDYLFVFAWQTSGTVGEIAARTNLSVGEVTKIAHTLRRRGVQLKDLRHTNPKRHRRDYGALRKFASDLLGQGA